MEWWGWLGWGLGIPLAIFAVAYSDIRPVTRIMDRKREIARDGRPRPPATDDGDGDGAGAGAGDESSRAPTP